MCKRLFKALKIKMDNYHLRYELAGADETISQLKQQLAEKEKEETKRMEDFEKGCQEYYKSNQTAIAVLKKVKKLFEEKYAYDVEESDFAVIYETDIDEIIDQQINNLRSK